MPIAAPFFPPRREAGPDRRLDVSAIKSRRAFGRRGLTSSARLRARSSVEVAGNDKAKAGGLWHCRAGSAESKIQLSLSFAVQIIAHSFLGFGFGFDPSSAVHDDEEEEAEN